MIAKILESTDYGYTLQIDNLFIQTLKDGKIYYHAFIDEDSKPVQRDHPFDAPYISDLSKLYPELISEYFYGAEFYGHTDVFVDIRKIA